MNTVALLRRAITPAPSPARAKLAEAIGAQTAAAERLALLGRALDSARSETAAAEAARALAREGAEHAAAHAHLHAVARLTGAPAPAGPTRADAAARLAVADAAAADALAAWQAIAAEAETLRTGERERADRVNAAAEGVVREEMQDAAEALAVEIVALQRAMIDKGRALLLLARHNIVATQAPAATPAASAARAGLAFPIMDSAAWQRPDASPTEARFAAALAALKADATAEVPK